MKRQSATAAFEFTNSLPDGVLGAAVFDHSRGRVAHWSSGFWERLGEERQEDQLSGQLLERFEALVQRSGESALLDEMQGLRLERIRLSEELSVLLLTRELQKERWLTSRIYNWHKESLTDVVGMIAENIQGTASSLLYNAAYLATKTDSIQANEARDDILATSKAATSLLSRLSDLVRLRESAREVVSVKDLVEGARSGVQRRHREMSVEIVQRVGIDFRLFTNVILAQQALSEVLLNAVESEGVSVVEINCEMLNIQGSPLVRIRVEDDGEGVAEHLTEKIFQPLFSTSAERSGLGLTVARESARALGGELILDRRKGPTSFALLLAGVPRHEKENAR